MSKQDYIIQNQMLMEDQRMMNETTVSGYVARDKNGAIYFTDSIPKRSRNKSTWLMIYFIDLPEGSFPSVTWDSEPQKVELTIKLI